MQIYKYFLKLLMSEMTKFYAPTYIYIFFFFIKNFPTIF